MPLEPEDAAMVWDMLSHARKAVRLVEGCTQNDLFTEDALRYAAERLIEIVGEAARKVSRSTQESNPAIPWQKIVQQRHVMAHDYGDIRLDALWRVLTIHIPALIPQLEAILPEPPEDPLPETESKR